MWKAQGVGCVTHQHQRCSLGWQAVEGLVRVLHRRWIGLLELLFIVKLENFLAQKSRANDS